MTVMSMVLSAASNSSNVNPPTPAPDFITWRNSVPPTSTSPTYTGLGYGGIAADGSGNVAVSSVYITTNDSTINYGPNATTKVWTSTAFALQSMGRGVYGAGIYVFCTNPGQTNAFSGVYTSTDGSTWTLRTSSAINFIVYNVSYANGIFFATGSAAVRTSTDGINWTVRSGYGSTTYYSVCKSTSYYVLAGATGVIRTTTDFVTWTLRTTSGTWNIYSVAAIGNTVVAVGAGEGIIRSTDGGVTWSSISYTGSAIDYQDVVTDGSQFVIYGGPSIGGAANTAVVVLTSTDGSTWTTRGTPEPTAYYGGGQLTYAGGTYYLAYSGYTSTPIGARTIITSTDAVTWNIYSNSVFYYGSFYFPATNTFVVLSGGGYLLSSSNNGSTWTSRRNQTSTQIITWSIAYGAGLYVAVGSGSSVRSSPDLVTWTARTNAPQSTSNAIIYANGQFVYVTSDYAVRSTNGTSWSSVLVAGSTLNMGLHGIAYGNSLYVVVGLSGYVWTSPDAITWTQRTVSGTPNFRGICWTGSLFVAVGQAGVIYTSPDGITWTSRTSGVTTQLWEVAYIGSTIVAVGASSRILTSTDGITWTARTSADTTKDYYGVSGNSSAAIVCGTNGYVVINP